MIDVVITAYNREKYLPLCIESILSQTYSNFNLVVWNDGSLDNSLGITKKYASFDSRVTVVNQKQQGFTQSLSQALKMTNSKYLAWVNIDDLILPTCLEEKVGFLESNPKYEMVYTQYFDIDEQGQELGLGHRCRYQYNQDVLLKLFITFHFRLIKRTAFEAIGGIDETYKFAADEDDMGCCPQTNALLYELLDKVDKLSEIVGVDEFPAELPKRLIYPNGRGNEKIDSLVELLGYQVKQIDRAVGYLPQKIKIVDTNPGKPGNQSVEVEIHSFADFAKEVLQYLIDTEGDGDVTNNMLVRILYELGFIHQGMVQADAMLDAVCEHLDFKQRWKKVKVPFAFDPYAGTKGKSGQGFGQSAKDNTEENVEELLPKLLQNTEVDIRVLVNDEKKSLNDLLQDIKRDTAIAAAAVSDRATPERLEQLVAAAQIILQLQSAIDRKNARQALTAGDLRTQKKK